MTASTAPALVLGAGYAGVAVAHRLSRRSKGEFPIELVDASPVHVVRTELFEVGQLAERGSDVRRWAIPLDRVLRRDRVRYREGRVERIDLGTSTIRVGKEEIPFGSLVIALGSVPAYFGVPGAAEKTHHVYGLLAAMRLAQVLRTIEANSSELPAGRRPKVMVVGGGSTGTEVSAEIATADWRRIASPRARPPDVTLVCGALPFLAGFHPELLEHARRLLFEAGVVLNEGHNVRSVEAGKAVLDDGSVVPFDVAVWAAGLEAPPVVRAVEAAHGHGGRLAVGPTLELPDHPGVFAVGDSAELTDPRTGISVPATAQAALAEAPTVAENVWRRRSGRPLGTFDYRERGVLVSVGRRRAAGRLSRVTVWGRPAALLKTLVEAEYRQSAEHGRKMP